MTFKEGDLPTPSHGSFEWMKNVEYKVPLAVFSVLLLFVVWETPPPSFLSYSRFSASQSETFFNRPASNDYTPASISSDESTLVVPLDHHNDSHSTEQDSQPKKPPTESLSPDPRQSTNPVDNTTASQINATSDVLAEDQDTKQVEEPAVQVQDAQRQPAEEKYLIPLLNPGGAGNQLIEYKTAATIARTLNRTLCLVPFLAGPSGHLGNLGDRHYSGLVMEDRYDTEILSKYVKVVSMDECVQKCESRVDAHWRLEKSKRPNWDRWFKNAPWSSSDFTGQYNNWTSTADVAATLSPRNDARCVGLGGIFPGLRWRGMMYASSSYVQHSQRIMKAADFFQQRSLGSNDSNFLSVHWRFEETNCKGHPLGLCFMRCTDGEVVANGRASDTWNNMTREDSQGRTGFSGVLVSREDVSSAIYDRAVQHGMHNVYLATDGWLRGSASAGILKWVVEDLRHKGLNVSGLWMVKNLPNFADGSYVHSGAMPGLFGLDNSENVSNYMIALVEQEICLRSSVFVGTGQSTWSLAVGDTRAGRRRKQELTELVEGLNLGTPPEVMEQAIIEKILQIQYTAWPTCIGSYNMTMKETSITKAEGEALDGWLDYDSCEDRLLRGVGQCIRITT